MYIIAKCSPKNYLHYSVIYVCWAAVKDGDSGCPIPGY